MTQLRTFYADLVRRTHQHGTSEQKKIQRHQTQTHARQASVLSIGKDKKLSRKYMTVKALPL